MTKERRLAIEMWKVIRDMFTSPHNITGKAIVEYKSEFCEQHELDWINNCWFCEYIPSCDKCPLKDCGIGSLYKIVVDSANDKGVRIAACNNIIKALGIKALGGEA